MHQYIHSQAFIDGANFWQACNRLDLNIDFRKLGAWLVETFDCTRINYYTAVKTERDQQQQKLRPLLDWLSYNGFNVVEKPARLKGFDENKQALYKGNMDIEIAIDCARLVHNTAIRRVLLFSGDGDFEPIVRYMQEYGAHVTVVSTNQSTPPILAENLRKAADGYFDIQDIRVLIEKDERKGDTIHGKEASV